MFPMDYIYIGPPTPEMEPLDDEARALSAEESKKWEHPIESLPGSGGFNQSLLANLETQLAQLVQAATSGKAVAAPDVSKTEFEEMKAQMKVLMEQNKVLMDQLHAQPKVDDAEPLGEVDPAELEAELPPPPKPTSGLARRSV